MPIFAMPILLMINADSAEEAQRNVDEWGEEVDTTNDLPVGTDSINTSPECENDDEGRRVLYLQNPDDLDEDLDANDEQDDFNESIDY